MTDQPKWTPGPWLAKWSKYEEGNFIVQAGMPSNRVLAQFDGDGDGPDAQSLADANLIAAAPDLYAALEHLLHDLDDLAANSEGVAGLHMNGDVADWESLFPEGTFGAWLAGVTTARAALAKARGQA